jgi:hypothetical protein
VGECSRASLTFDIVCTHHKMEWRCASRFYRPTIATFAHREWRFVRVLRRFRTPLRHCIAIAASALLASSCKQPSFYPPTASRYLYVWAGDADGKDSDFLAVVDASPESRSYGQVINSEPVGMQGTAPAALEYALPDSGQLLFANGHQAELLFLFDTRDARRPHLVRTIAPPRPLRFPHDIVRLPNKHVLVSYLRSEGPSPATDDRTMPGNHGGVAELDTNGKVIRWGSAADNAYNVPIRPYSFAVLPAIDRIVVTSAQMLEDTSADVVQIWQLSTLSKLQTLQLPLAHLANGELLPHGHQLPFEPRVMPDGSVLLNAYGCGFYRVTDIDKPQPRIDNVYAIDVPSDGHGACGVPIVAGNYWIMAVGSTHMLVTLDVRDPAHPREVARLRADTLFHPYWLARDPGANRIIVGAENGGETRMLMVTFDPTSGLLAWDTSFQDSDGSLGVSFDRPSWPHGATGPAFSHAAVFRP